MTLRTMPGFGNDFETEALPGALPEGQNSPQRCAYGLYAEQLSGSPFTAPKGLNERSWLYRIRPSVKHTARFSEIEVPDWKTAPHIQAGSLGIGQFRWDPTPLPSEPTTFVAGMRTMTTAGDVFTQAGMAAHIWCLNAPMQDEYFFNADGELLLAPWEGGVRIFSELGLMEIGPTEIAVIPRGMIVRIEPMAETSRGYACENYGAKFTLPDRDPANFMKCPMIQLHFETGSMMAFQYTRLPNRNFDRRGSLTDQLFCFSILHCRIIQLD